MKRNRCAIMLRGAADENNANVYIAGNKRQSYFSPASMALTPKRKSSYPKWLAEWPGARIVEEVEL